MKFLGKIDGYKTYIGAACLFIAGGCLALGWITQKEFELVASVMAAWTAFGIRDAIKKLE